MTISKEVADRLRDEVQKDYPESIILDEQNPMVVGKFIRLEEGNTTYGPAKIVVLETEDGKERSLWLIHTVLRNQFARVRPVPGEVVAVLWKGKKRGATATYDDYNVKVDRKVIADADWSSISEAGDEVVEAELSSNQPPARTAGPFSGDDWNEPEPESGPSPVESERRRQEAAQEAAHLPQSSGSRLTPVDPKFGKSSDPDEGISRIRRLITNGSYKAPAVVQAAAVVATEREIRKPISLADLKNFDGAFLNAVADLLEEDTF